MKEKIFWISILLTIVVVSGEKTRFDNYTLYKILPENDQHIKLLQELQTNDVNYDFWSDPAPSSEFVSVLSNPQSKYDLENILNLNKIKFEISIPNIQEAIDKETVRSYNRNNVRSMTWDAYYPLEDIESWMLDMADTYPDIVTPVVGGSTYEGRDINGLRIAHGEGKRIIFVEAGIHSREWVVMTFACYLINELLTSNDSETMAAARDFEWYIFPVTNPDGYVWTQTEFRLWRKNRRPVGENFGIDLNRNWNNNWLVVGASTNPASDTYAGTGPFSEPETRTLSEYIRSVSDRMDIYLSIHSFSQLLLLPFGNTTDPLANYDDAMQVGRRAMGALSVRYGTQYVSGNIAEAIYQASGGSIDWVKEALNIPLVYCYELRDRGAFGFLLPTEQILPNHLETMDSILELIHQAKRFGLTSAGTEVTASLVIVLLSMFAVYF